MYRTYLNYVHLIELYLLNWSATGREFKAVKYDFAEEDEVSNRSLNSVDGCRLISWVRRYLSIYSQRLRKVWQHIGIIGVRVPFDFALITHFHALLTPPARELDCIDIRFQLPYQEIDGLLPASLANGNLEFFKFRFVVSTMISANARKACGVIEKPDGARDINLTSVGKFLRIPFVSFVLQTIKDSK